MMRKGTCVLALAVLIAGAFQLVAATSGPSYQWPPAYHTYASMVSELQGLAAAHPDLLMMESIGKTYEGRDIWAVKLSDDVAANDSAEPDVLIFGGIHAREIMGPEVPIFVLNYMLNGYGINETLSNDINTRETWFVPMLNPDGHVYVEGGSDWRGNRRPTSGGNIGVDLNRNWGYMFGVDGATSDDPASQVYHGPYPFSECETAALRDLALRQRFATSLSYHSVASLVLYPWGFTAAAAPDHDELDAMARKMASWNGYTPEQSSTLYFTHGDSEDWFYANTSTLAFTIELDTAFYPPESQIPISCGLNREPTLYLIGYPNASIVDAGVFGLPAPVNNTLIEPDREMNVSALVMNYGSNETDIPVSAEIDSGAYHWSNSSSIRLRPGQAGLCNLSWLPPLAVGENCTVTVRTTLPGDSFAGNDERAGRFRIMPRYGAALEAENGDNRSCFPGENVSFPMLLRSLGNRDDEIRLELSGGKAAWAAIDPSVRLPPAGTQDVFLNVTVPRTATPGDTATISVRAFSSTGQGAAGLVNTKTSVLDPAPTAVAGDDITINVTREIIFDGTGSTTPTGALVDWSWDFGDGTTADGAVARHAYQKRGFYVVNLTVRNELGYGRTDSLNVTVQQEFRLALKAAAATMKPASGETVGIDFTIRNDGNGPDNIALALDALRWNASIDAGNVSLQAGGELAFRLNMTAPSDAAAGATAMFRVTAQSLESPYSRDEVVLTATVREVRDFTFNILDTTRRADAPRSVRFTGVFVNNGNIAESANLTASGVPEGWMVEFSPPDVTSGPWSNQSVTITVGVPASALAGDYALSVNGVGLAITVNARYGLDAALENSTAAARPGGTVSFNLTVFNDANAPDTFAISVADMPAGWPAPAIGQLGTLAARGNGTVRITMSIPRNATAGLFEPRITVRSGGDGNQSRLVPVQVTVQKRAEPATVAPGEFPWLPIVLVIVIIAAVAAVMLVATRRKGPPAETPPQTAPSGSYPPEDGVQGYP